VCNRQSGSTLCQREEITHQGLSFRQNFPNHSLVREILPEQDLCTLWLCCMNGTIPVVGDYCEDGWMGCRCILQYGIRIRSGDPASSECHSGLRHIGIEPDERLLEGSGYILEVLFHDLVAWHRCVPGHTRCLLHQASCSDQEG